MEDRLPPGESGAVALAWPYAGLFAGIWELSRDLPAITRAQESADAQGSARPAGLLAPDTDNASALAYHASVAASTLSPQRDETGGQTSRATQNPGNASTVTLGPAAEGHGPAPTDLGADTRAAARFVRPATERAGSGADAAAAGVAAAPVAANPVQTRLEYPVRVEGVNGDPNTSTWLPLVHDLAAKGVSHSAAAAASRPQPTPPSKPGGANHLPRRGPLDQNPAGLIITGYSLGEPVLDANSYGDTWGPAWSTDGQLHTPSDDTRGFDEACVNSDFPYGYDIASNVLTGDPRTGDLHGTSISCLQEYGQIGGGCETDQCDNWKATNMTSVNGVLYMGITVTQEVFATGLQPQHNASIVASQDGGVTWSPTHTYENDPSIMWPGESAFSAPYFVDYGQDPGPAGDPSWPDGADQYVYAVSTDSGVRDNSNLYLGRVPRSQIQNLQAHDWQFVTGFDANQNPTWGPFTQATPVLGVLHGDDVAGKLGWTTAQWVAAIQKYVMIEWNYPNPLYQYQDTSTWRLFEADHVWGPWQQFGPDYTWAPGDPSTATEGDYMPVVPTMYMDTQVDTSTYPYQLNMWVLTTGNWQFSQFYKLTAVPLTLELTPPSFYVAAPDTVAAGQPFDLTVYAVDPNGNVDPDYTGTISFYSASDPSAVLPADYTFTPADGGAATFPAGATLYTAGLQDVSVSDTATGFGGSAFVNVAPGHR